MSYRIDALKLLYSIQMKSEVYEYAYAILHMISLIIHQHNYKCTPSHHTYVYIYIYLCIYALSNTYMHVYILSHIHLHALTPNIYFPYHISYHHGRFIFRLIYRWLSSLVLVSALIIHVPQLKAHDILLTRQYYPKACFSTLLNEGKPLHFVLVSCVFM